MFNLRRLVIVLNYYSSSSSSLHIVEVMRIYNHIPLIFYYSTHCIQAQSVCPSTASSSLIHSTGFLRSGKVRESQGKQRGSGKSQGILKYCSLDQLFMHYFHNFCRLLGARPPDPHRGSASVNTAG